MKPRHRTAFPQDTDNTSSDRIVPRKDLGQNFLRDPNIARNIVRDVDVRAGDSVLEIGPGEGALTALLLETSARELVAVEYDARAVELLTKRFRAEIASGRLRVVQSDVLAVRLDEVFADDTIPLTHRQLKIVGNIPYYITSDILFWVFDEWARLHISGNAASAPTKTVIMMQKEVAQRIAAKPRTKDYGILSIASQLVSEPKLLFQVSPHCFFPQPNVTSAVVAFQMKSEREAAEAYRMVHPLVRTAFNQRRKVLSNALSSILQKERLPEILHAAEERGISYFRQRAEELTPQDFVRLYDFIREFR
jgi:16S rRNA (adenine1518-N6/adenine1519-N6)-dimethyltransferase